MTQKLHRYFSPTQPPLCGQKDRRGLRYLPARCTTLAPWLVNCEKCLHLATPVPAALPTAREVLEFAAAHSSSDWPARCQEIVRLARASLLRDDA